MLQSQPAAGRQAGRKRAGGGLGGRMLLVGVLAGMAGAVGAGVARPVLAAAEPAVDPQQATGFIRQAGAEIARLVTGSGTPTEKRARLEPFVQRVVDVDGVARFCLGRFWRLATPAQQQEYLTLFRQVLLNSIMGRLGDYPEGQVRVTVNKAEVRDGNVNVVTTLDRTNQAPDEVTWVVGGDTGTPKIVDVVVEGTSMRLTQRNDYSSFISRNGGNVQTLLDAMRHQLSQT